MFNNLLLKIVKNINSVPFSTTVKESIKVDHVYDLLQLILSAITKLNKVDFEKIVNLRA